MPSINDLAGELLNRIKSIAEFENKGFTIYNPTELEHLSDYVPLPLVGVIYNGAQKQENSAVSATGKAPTLSTTFITVYFTVILAINYKYSADSDTKIDALGLLDALRSTILGYKGVNSRPWIFNGEQPLGSETEGVIFYGQTWETNFPISGVS
jgi:hypothetical protein